jgi:RHS repeat-associated protein
VIEWPGGQENADGQLVNRAVLNTWWGNLISEKLDASGMKYMRNRYYSPETGQFTQQDPIGLAGGMNLYGFAAGDPVNFSDPMGLCVPWPSCANDYWEAAAISGHQQGGVRGTAKALGAVLMGTMIEGFGINTADRGMDELAAGNIGKGVFLIGMAVSENLPLGEGERVIFGGKKISSTVARQIGLSRRELGNRIEAIKKAGGLGGKDNVLITNLGNVLDKATREVLDNIHDVIPKK